MLDELFSFPIIMIDGDNEERKSKDRSKYGDILNGEESMEYDIIYGEAEYPYWDFVGIEDRWIPHTESLNKAIDQGEFEACMVRFLHVGQLLVPWSKEKFKKEIKKFALNYETIHPKKTSGQEQIGVKVVDLTKEQFNDKTKDENE